MGFITHKPIVEIVDDPEVVEDILGWYVKKHPHSSTVIFGWDPKRDYPIITNLATLVDDIKIVKICI